MSDRARMKNATFAENYSSKPKFKKGDKLRCVGWRTSNGSLRANAIYTALEDEEEPDCIGKAFIYVADEDGKDIYCHSNRVVLHE